jgi:glyoxylase-like metal-dependent hydrolase (beta-lactamase superfamily II)
VAWTSEAWFGALSDSDASMTEFDFEPKSGATATRSADAILAHISTQELVLDWVLDTHPHADHFSAAGYLKDKTGARTGIGEQVVDITAIKQVIISPEGEERLIPPIFGDELSGNVEDVEP